MPDVMYQRMDLLSGHFVPERLGLCPQHSGVRVRKKLRLLLEVSFHSKSFTCLSSPVSFEN